MVKFLGSIIIRADLTVATSNTTLHWGQKKWILQTTDNKTFLLCGRWILSKLPPLCQNQIHRHSKCLFTPTLHPYSWVFLYLGLYLFIYLFIHPSIHSFLGAQSLMCLRLSSISLSSWRWVYTSDPPFPAFQVLRFRGVPLCLMGVVPRIKHITSWRLGKLSANWTLSLPPF